MWVRKHIDHPKHQWLKAHLFASWLHTLLTLGSLYVFYRVLVPMIAFVFRDANWEVVGHNLHLFALGSYPADQVWRVSLLVALLMGMMGATLATRTTMGRVSGALFAALALGAILYTAKSTGSNETGPTALNRFFPISGLILYMLGYFLQKKQSFHVKYIVAGWCCTVFLCLLLLSGFDGSTVLPKVESHLWGGLLLTCLVTIVGIVASFPLGVALALGRRSHLRLIQLFCIGFIEILRGVPLITILFMGQILIPLFFPPDLILSNLLRVMIAVTFFSAAYMAEYIRGGLQAIPSGQIEAAQALGMNVFQTNFFIVLPQAIRAVIPALVGQCIALFKDTSLVAIVGLLDLTGAAKAAIGQPDFLGLEAEVFMAIALVYWMISYSMSNYSRRLEKTLGIGLR
ncbi:MAG: amino acid ABC transporter permease [Nitrospiria bacterium]